MLGGIGGRRRRGRQRMRRLDWITDSMGMGLGRLWELVMDREILACCDSWGHKESDMTERLNWAKQWFPTFLAQGTWFCGRQFFHGLGGGGFGWDNSSHYIYCALCFYYYYISSTSDHQALDPRGWGPLLYKVVGISDVQEFLYKVFTFVHKLRDYYISREYLKVLSQSWFHFILRTTLKGCYSLFCRERISVDKLYKLPWKISESKKREEVVLSIGGTDKRWCFELWFSIW